MTDNYATTFSFGSIYFIKLILGIGYRILRNFNEIVYNGQWGRILFRRGKEIVNLALLLIVKHVINNEKKTRTLIESTIA